MTESPSKFPGILGLQFSEYPDKTISGFIGMVPNISKN